MEHDGAAPAPDLAAAAFFAQQQAAWLHNQQQQAAADQAAAQQLLAEQQQNQQAFDAPLPPNMPLNPTMKDFMQVFVQIFEKMTVQQAASSGFQPGGGGMSNVRLDERNFRRCEKFNNKPESWREWAKHFISAVRECDASFSDYMTMIEKQEQPIESISLSPVQSQLSATLHTRLYQLTNQEAWKIVDGCDGNGIEAWRLLVHRYEV